MRYHINPVTGEPGKCRAKLTCPFGDLEAEHYPTLTAAREAFEAANREAALASLRQPREEQVALQAELVKLLEERLEEEKDKGRRAYLLRHLGQVGILGEDFTRERYYAALRSAERRFLELGREDLAEVARWTSRVFEASMNTRVATRDLKRVQALLATAKGEEREQLLADERYFLERLPQAEAFDRSYMERLRGEKFTQKASEIPSGARVYEGAREAVFLNPGEAISMEQALEGASLRELYAGRGTVVQREALAKVQGHGEELVALLSDGRGRFILPENPGWDIGAAENKAEDPQAVMDDYFPPRNGFRMLNAGAETIAYLHEPSQMVYKLHHNDSYALGYSGNATEERSRFAVLLHEDRYLRLQEEREVLASVGVEYASTYFLHLQDGQGEEVSLVAQPYLDPAIYTPLDIGGLKVETAAGPTNYSQYLGSMGLTDLHAGNVFYNNRTGQAVLFDCLFMEEDSFEDEVRQAGLEDPFES